ncbi:MULTISPECIES: SDR family oxidoreductase [unclassified Bosea (in: a-proteobacteria)]|uniref:SDR family oxidoreductase n=1 Tax=unclassified Bosea (in: a-proteobacteria) TaxID=2653178 RepID=UPI000F750146|nr:MULTISPECIES: SDR family oxidoreductase [unclassified Bosea (in: a-proteobacteria)]AZO76422.1 short-chain dehydrogenase [Bosea sp. Tri-49]RXT26350.1 short-chain dehydrogenase [Bosea sp. Tri-39]RXT31590.1 short-chain dehydrogenase [Bosea sp. Tri-54]
MPTGALAGRVAVITGAGRGLGTALAISLSEAGCRPILCGRNPAGLAATAAMIRERTGIEPAFVALDLADAASVQAAGQAIATSVGGIDILINNGAMWLEARSEPYSAEEVLGVVNAAVTGTFLLTQALLPALKRSACPDIVTIGSISGLPNAALQSVSVPFYAAKHGQAALADGFRQMLAGTPIRSIAIHPPYLDDMLPGDADWQASPQRAKGSRASNRDVVEAVIFALTRPRHVTLSITLDADDGGQFPHAAGD